MTDTTWAAKVLEGVPRLSAFQTRDVADRATDLTDRKWLRYDDALAAIARMGTGDGLVERLLAVDHMDVEDCFTQSPLFTQAAARIAALTAERDEAECEKDRLAEINRNLCNSHNILLVDGSNWQARAEAAEAERDSLRAKVVQMEGALQRISNEYSVKWQAGQWSRAALTDGGKDE